MPKIALISDVHANLPAMEAVLEALEKEQPDIWISLGDIVGYGPHPSECVSLIQDKNMLCVLGNHDAGVCGKMPVRHFRNPNRRLIQMTKDRLSSSQQNWLSGLPLLIKNEELDILAVHASPTSPEEWEYLESAFKVREILGTTQHRFCLAGHTHRPALVSDTIGVNDLKTGHRYFINPGSVGQSRDGDPRASCGILDTDENSYKNIRVHFDTEKVVTDLEYLGFSRREAKQMMRYT